MLCPRSARAAPSRAALSAAQALRLLDQWFRSFGLTSYFDFLNALKDTLPEAFRHGGVLEIVGHLFAVFRCPFQKFDELLSFGRILLLLINQYPSCTRNRIRIRTRRIGDGKEKIIRNIGRCQRGRYR